MNRNGLPQLIGWLLFICQTRFLLWFAAIDVFVSPAWTYAQETATPPLHQQIDQLLQPKDATLPHTEVAESLLLRRLYLDLVGVPPTLAEFQAYQADNTPDKYSILVNKLLQSPEFIEHWVKQLDLMFMERRANTNIAQLDWEDYLRKSLLAQQPFNQLCGEILSATGVPGASRPAARFYLDRGGDPNLITRDVGRVFFGRDLQCAQCHDHPLIDSYFQSDFHGIAAFFSGGYMVEVPEGDKKLQVYAEKSLLESPYESVFHKGSARRTFPRIPGAAEVVPPSVQPGADYDVAPADGVAAKPKYSRRTQLAQLTTSGSNAAFNENWANRFWTLVYGRGVIHPADLIHADAEPLHPELLPLLGQRFAESGFQLRSFIGELVHTKLYRSGQSEPFDTTSSQRAKEVVDVSDWKKILADRQARWEAAKSQLAALGEQTGSAKDALFAIEQERTTLLAALDQARAALISVNDAQTKAAAEVAAADKNVVDEQAKQAKIQAASTATDEAKALLNQDADVAKAAEILQQKLATLTTSITNLNAAAEEKRKVLAAAQTATETQRVAWAAADKAVTDKNTAYHQADQTYVAARHVEEQARRTASSMKREVDYAKFVVNVRDSIEELEAKSAELAQAVAQVEAFTTEKTARLNKVAALEPQLIQATRDRDQTQEIVQAQQQRLQDAEGKHQLIVAAQAALQKLPDNQADTLRAAMDEIQRRLGDSDSMLVNLRQEMQTQQTTLANAQTKLAQLQETKATEEMAIAKVDASLAAIETTIQQSEIARTAARENYVRKLQELRRLRMERFEYSKLVALTPEQLAWSLLSSMGFVERQIAARLADIDKATPLTAEQQQDQNLLQQRKLQAYLQARKELQGNVNIFVSLYGAGAGQPQSDFFATADQALFANNGGVIFSWAAAAGDNITSKFANSTNMPEATTQLYLALLGRVPSEEEMADVQQYMSQAPDQKVALAQELVWGILTSAEFRFNH
jgi:uncharacterized protein YnzC (UPF0291/DUF896 family)